MKQGTRRQPTQAPASVVMVRPHNFAVNTETAIDNAFQGYADPDTGVGERAYEEISRVATTLDSLGLRVHLFEDEGTGTPDSAFPNNWFSTHADGHIAIYPMKAANRRLERRHDVIELLKREYRVQDVVDYTGLETDGLFLEGTGAMVLDHIDRAAYLAESSRANPIALERFCTRFNYEPMAFTALDPNGLPIYHTNVLMCVATEFALVGLDLIKGDARRAEIKARLENTGKTVIPLSFSQIAQFAGNAIELQGSEDRILALSKTAYDALEESQKALIEESAVLVPLDIPTIELSGGSVRCTIAGIHLLPRS